MNATSLFFALLCAALLLGLQRRLAPFPFLLGALYMPAGQVIEVGPFHFTAMRLLIAAGFLRMIIKGERFPGGLSSLDRFMIFWAIWAVCSSFFHGTGALVFRLGFTFNHLGTYFLLRVFIQSLNDFQRIVKMVAVLLVPLAIGMMMEHLTGTNAFSFVGGEIPEVRSGSVRAQGPFSHSILAGTVGAVCLPLAILLWRRNRWLAVTGLAAAGAVIVASASTGPIMTAAFTLGALGFWKVRRHLRSFRWAVVIAIVLLSIVMKAPPYYLLARIDLTGSSTGWHRAALIGAAIDHLGEWWLAGTDFTRHWMPTGIQANENNTDITNVYIMMGVIGGLPLMCLFIGALSSGFAAVGRTLRQMKDVPPDIQFSVWTLGAIMFGHATTFFTVDYFDQTIVLYYLALAAAASIAICTSRSVLPFAARGITGFERSKEIAHGRL